MSTTTEGCMTEVAKADRSPCPSWCTGHHLDEEVLHPTDMVHGGELVTIGLDLVEPTRSDDLQWFGTPGWTPAELTVSLNQRQVAAWPTVTIGSDNGAIESSVELTIFEAIELRGALDRILNQVFPRDEVAS
jgi:hypothetical protein